MNEYTLFKQPKHRKFTFAFLSRARVFPLFSDILKSSRFRGQKQISYKKTTKKNKRLPTSRETSSVATPESAKTSSVSTPESEHVEIEKTFGIEPYRKRSTKSRKTSSAAKLESSEVLGIQPLSANIDKNSIDPPNVSLDQNSATSFNDIESRQATFVEDGKTMKTSPKILPVTPDLGSKERLEEKMLTIDTDRSRNIRVRFDQETEEDLSSTSSSTDPIIEQACMSTPSEAYLQTIVQELKCELSAEQAIRRKKDQSIVKLAKQLKERSEESDAKERQIYKMAKTINDLEDLLHNHHRELAEDQEKIRKVCRETEARLEENEALVLSLRKELFNSRVEVETLRLQLQQQESLSPRSNNAVECIIQDGECVKEATAQPISRWRQSAALFGAGIAATGALGFSLLFNSDASRDSINRYRVGRE